MDAELADRRQVERRPAAAAASRPDAMIRGLRRPRPAEVACHRQRPGIVANETVRAQRSVWPSYPRTYFALGEYGSRCRAALKCLTPAPFGAMIADMSPHHSSSLVRRWPKGPGKKGFAAVWACTAIAFVFRKACSRGYRSSFALACRPLSRYFCKKNAQQSDHRAKIRRCLS
jgi:hypothetical protein